MDRCADQYVRLCWIKLFAHVVKHLDLNMYKQLQSCREFIIRDINKIFFFSTQWLTIGLNLEVY